MFAKLTGCITTDSSPLLCIALNPALKQTRIFTSLLLVLLYLSPLIQHLVPHLQSFFCLTLQLGGGNKSSSVMLFLSPSSHGTEANYSSPQQRTTFVFLITVAWKVSHPVITQWFISSDKICPSLDSLFLQTALCVSVDNITRHSYLCQ